MDKFSFVITQCWWERIFVSQYSSLSQQDKNALKEGAGERLVQKQTLIFSIVSQSSCCLRLVIFMEAMLKSPDVLDLNGETPCHRVGKAEGY